MDGLIATQGFQVNVQYFSPDRHHPIPVDTTPGRWPLGHEDGFSASTIESRFIPSLCAGFVLLQVIRGLKYAMGSRYAAEGYEGEDWLNAFERDLGLGLINLPSPDVPGQFPDSNLSYELDGIQVIVEIIGISTQLGSFRSTVRCIVRFVTKHPIGTGIVSTVVGGLMLAGISQAIPQPDHTQAPACYVQVQYSQSMLDEARRAADDIVSRWPTNIVWGAYDREIVAVQAQLNLLRPYGMPGIKTDGIWGSETDFLARVVFAMPSAELRTALDVQGYAPRGSKHAEMQLITHPLVAKALAKDSWLCARMRPPH